MSAEFSGCFASNSPRFKRKYTARQRIRNSHSLAEITCSHAHGHMHVHMPCTHAHAHATAVTVPSPVLCGGGAGRRAQSRREKGRGRRERERRDRRGDRKGGKRPRTCVRILRLRESNSQSPFDRGGSLVLFVSRRSDKRHQQGRGIQTKGRVCNTGGGGGAQQAAAGAEAAARNLSPTRVGGTHSPAHGTPRTACSEFNVSLNAHASK